VAAARPKRVEPAATEVRSGREPTPAAPDSTPAAPTAPEPNPALSSR
jgi:hypothetical protein